MSLSSSRIRFLTIIILVLLPVRLLSAGEPVPVIEFVDALTGEWVSTEDMAGDFIFLHFWKSTCPPCEALTPALCELYTQYSRQGVRFIGVTADSEYMDFLKYCREYGIEWPQYCNPSESWPNKLASEWDVYSVPKVFIITPDKEIVTDRNYLTAIECLPNLIYSKQEKLNAYS